MKSKIAQKLGAKFKGIIKNCYSNMMTADFSSHLEEFESSIISPRFTVLHVPLDEKEGKFVERNQIDIANIGF
jgi:hypothetical protein